MAALTPQAQQAVNSMFMQRAMHGGADDYLDIDFGGVLSKRQRSKKAKEGAAKNILTEYRRRWRAMNGSPGSFKNPLFYNSYCKFVSDLNRHTGFCNKLANKSMPYMGPMQVPAIPKDVIDRIAMKNIQEANQQAYSQQACSQPGTFDLLSQMGIPVKNVQQMQYSPGVFSESDIFTAEAPQTGFGEGILVGGVVKRRKRKGTSNPWSRFITAWARKHGKTLTQAMESAQAKKEYCTWIGKSKKSLGVVKKRGKKKCGYSTKPTAAQKAKRKRVDSCLRRKGKKASLASIMKCRAAGILV